MAQHQVPGITMVHSHAFQFALRARAQRFPRGEGSFWSWRKAMYDLVNALTPDEMYRTARSAYAALYAYGVRCVGEFHYVHHAPGGTPYADPDCMAHAVIRAAQDTGMRIALLRSHYERPGFDRVTEDGQLRFFDKAPEKTFAAIERLESFYRDDTRVRIELAPHSMRACRRESLAEIFEYAQRREKRVHMHLSEQTREVDECLAEYGQRPVEVLSDMGALQSNLTLVHATHLSLAERKLLRDAPVTLCFSRSTERDLADGSPHVVSLFADLNSRTRLAFGVDGFAELDPFLEARSLEFDERTRTHERPAALEAERLLSGLTYEGYASLGFSRADCDADVQVWRTGDELPWPDTLIFAPFDHGMDEREVSVAATAP